jgi:hypothetical protein
MLLGELFWQAIFLYKSLGSLCLLNKKRIVLVITDTIADDSSCFRDSFFSAYVFFDRHNAKLIKINNIYN